MNEGSPATAEAIHRLIEELNRLPGIGPKSAQRLTYHLLRAPEEQLKLLAEAILSVKREITLSGMRR